MDFVIYVQYLKEILRVNRVISKNFKKKSQNILSIMQVVKLTKNLLPIYRDLFKVDWPKSIQSYCLLGHFISRFNNHPEWEQKVEFLTLKDHNSTDGTFAMIYGSYIYVDTLEAAPYPKLQDLLYHLDLKNDQMFSNIRDDFRPIIFDIMRMRKLEQTYEYGAKIVYFDVDEEYILKHRKK